MLNAVLQRLVEERQRVHEDLDRVMEGAASEDRDPSESETDLLKRHRARLEELEPQIEELLRTEETRQSAADARKFLTRTAPAKVESGEPPADPANDEVVYRSFGQFARDEIITRFPVIAARAGQGEVDRAKDRLERAVAHTLTADIPGLLPSQHMAELIGVINKTRPVVAASRTMALNAGTVTYPEITGRPTVGPQTAEKTELPSAKMQVALRTANAAVYGGAGNLSWQDIAWSNPDALSLWFDLAAEAWAKQTEDVATTALEAIAGTPIQVATTAPGTAPGTLAEWMKAIATAAGQIYATSGRRPDTLACDIATGYGLLGLVGTEAPVFISAGGGNMVEGTGNIAGLKLVISPMFSADYAVVGDFSQLLTAETPGAPVELRAVEPSIAGFEVGVIGAFLAKVIDPNAFRELNPPGGATTRAARKKADES